MPSGHGLYESDTSRLAQGELSEKHISVINRRAQRLSGDPTGTPAGTAIPTATQPFLKAVSDEAVQETRGFFEENYPDLIEKKERPIFDKEDFQNNT